ncbi:MAG: flagellar biosynthetic protein FliO [Planctomycetota bacterium]|jgi:flagellar biogenesis protein FliO
MSPFPIALRTAALALLITTAASGQPVEPGSPSSQQPKSADVNSAEPAPGGLDLAPQESRALGPLPQSTGPGRGGAGGPRSAARGLDPRVSEILRVGWALGAVVALLLLLRVGLRRLGGPLAGGGRPSGVLEVLARYPVARGQQLVLLKLCGRVVLLHQARTGMTTLAEVSDPDEVAAVLGRVGSASAGSARGPAGFSTLLDRLLARPGPAPDDEFARTLGRESEIGGKVVVDLTRRTRRPRRQPVARGGGR